MKREVRVRVDFIVELDDDGMTLPSIGDDPAGTLARVAELIVPGAAALAPGGKISVGFTRASSREVRRLARLAARGGSS